MLSYFTRDAEPVEPWFALFIQLLYSLAAILKLCQNAWPLMRSMCAPLTTAVLPLLGGVFLKYEAQSFLENENWSLEDLRNSQSSAQYANWKDNLPKGRLYSSAMLC